MPSAEQLFPDPVELPHEELVRLDRAHVWHPFTQMQVWARTDPVVIVAGEGNWLIDSHGRRYLDAVSSLWCNLIGHRHPVIDAAIRRQLEHVGHTTLLGQVSPPSAVLAAKLAALAPGRLPRVFYSDSGSTAVEVAVKMAFQCWRQRGQSRRQRFLAFGNAYHGDTIGSVSLGGIGLFHGVFAPLTFEVVRVRAPYCYRCPWGLERASCALECAREAREQILAVGDELAAVVVEPMVQAAAGMIVQPPGFLRAVADATREAGALLILDEIATGFGRTGELFACMHEGVEPDILCIAKGLTGGYLPVAATLATEEIYAAFLGEPTDLRTFFHGHTFTGNALGCAAALACLDVLDREAIMAAVPAKAAHLGRGLARLAALPAVGECRHLGLIAAVELVAERATRTPFAAALGIGARVCRAAIARGVWLRPLGDSIVVFLPLSITLEEIDTLVDVLGQAITEVTAPHLPGAHA